ncbi:hypothetical protein [Paenibacillus aceris]|nr:hypothetical protein [Paenibacillus aceris]
MESVIEEKILDLVHIRDRVRGQFSEKEISDLTFSVMAINVWNRINVAFKNVPGSADKAYGLTKAGLS